MPRRTSKGYNDPVLANIAMDYSDAALKGLASNAIFPSVGVAKRDSKYVEFSKGNLAMPASTLLATNGGRPARVGFSQAEKAINTEDKGLEGDVDLSDAQQMDNPYAPHRTRVLKRVINSLVLGEEIAARDALKALPSGNKTALSGDGSAVGNQWSGAGGDPVGAVTAIRKNMYVRPNTMVIGRDVMYALEGNKKLKDDLKNVVTTENPRIVDEALLAHVFRVQRVVVAEPFTMGREKRTGAATPEYIWDGLVWLGFVDAAPGPDSLTFGARFYVEWPEADGLGWVVSRYEDEAAGILGAEVLKVTGSSAHKILCKDCGHLITGVLA